MGLENSAARLANSTAAIAPTHRHRLRVRNVYIDARMPHSDRALAGGRRVADGLDQARFNRRSRSRVRLVEQFIIGDFVQ
jgi:hypothetical protein